MTLARPHRENHATHKFRRDSVAPEVCHPRPRAGRLV